MVLGKTLHLELPRRVVVYYLLFCLMAVCCLLLSGVMATHLVIQAQSENSALTMLERASSKLELSYARSQLEDLQDTVEQVCRDQKPEYCAVVGPAGSYLAHSTSNQIGRPAGELAGDRQRWGVIECVTYPDERGRMAREYRVPLRHSEEEFGELRMGTRHPSPLAVIVGSGQILPIACLGPVVLLAVGALVLQRVVRPLSEVDAQLRRIAVTLDVSPAALSKVRVRGPGALGWNRLVNEVQQGTLGADFEDRVAASLQTHSSNRAYTLLNSLPDGIAVTNEQGVITTANQAFLAFLGRGPDQPLPTNSTVEQCLDLNNAASDGSLLALHQSTRQTVTEIQRTTDGECRHMRVARYPLRSDDAGERGHVWTLRDITQQKLADKMRDEFLDSATHELRTPLANIRAYAETLALADVLELEQQKEFCNTINSEATRLARLIDDLLSVSSMEAGSLSIARKNTDVDRLLREVADKVRGQMEQKHITFESFISEKIPEMSLDKDKISAALVNLLGNAAKYTPEGGRVALKARVEDTHLIIEVEDNGIGIAPDELSKVFGKFFRSSDERVRNITGTGLGLSLAHEIVLLHGGTLSARSELNKGSTFTVALRL